MSGLFYIHIPLIFYKTKFELYGLEFINKIPTLCLVIAALVICVCAYSCRNDGLRRLVAFAAWVVMKTFHFEKGAITHKESSVTNITAGSFGIVGRGIGVELIATQLTK